MFPMEVYPKIFVDLETRRQIFDNPYAGERARRLVGRSFFDDVGLPQTCFYVRFHLAKDGTIRRELPYGADGQRLYKKRRPLSPAKYDELVKELVRCSSPSEVNIDCSIDIDSSIDRDPTATLKDFSAAAKRLNHVAGILGRPVPRWHINI